MFLELMDNKKQRAEDLQVHYTLQTPPFLMKMLLKLVTTARSS
jgi:hypothetical protein